MSDQADLLNKEYDPTNVRAGASYYNLEHNTVYYQGDGTNTSVSLPDGKAVEAITPASDYFLYIREDGSRFVVFAEAIKFGVMVVIALKDEGKGGQE